MEILLGIINLFCIPMVAVRGCYRRKLLCSEIPVAVHWLTTAAEICVAVNLLLHLLGYLLGREFVASGLMYSLCALAAALIYPIAVEFVHKYISITVRVNKEKSENEEKLR